MKTTFKLHEKESTSSYWVKLQTFIILNVSEQLYNLGKDLRP